MPCSSLMEINSQGAKGGWGGVLAAMQNPTSDSGD